MRDPTFDPTKVATPREGTHAPRKRTAVSGASCTCLGLQENRDVTLNHGEAMYVHQFQVSLKQQPVSGRALRPVSVMIRRRPPP